MNMLLLGALVFWLAAWALNVWLSKRKMNRGLRLLVPVIFGVTLLVIWELVVRGLEVKAVLLPPPSMIGRLLPTTFQSFGRISFRRLLRVHCPAISSVAVRRLSRRS